MPAARRRRTLWRAEFSRRDPGYGPASRRPGMIQWVSGMGRSRFAGSSGRVGFIVVLFYHQVPIATR